MPLDCVHVDLRVVLGKSLPLLLRRLGDLIILLVRALEVINRFGVLGWAKERIACFFVHWMIVDSPSIVLAIAQIVALYMSVLLCRLWFDF